MSSDNSSQKGLDRGVNRELQSTVNMATSETCGKCDGSGVVTIARKCPCCKGRKVEAGACVLPVELLAIRVAAGISLRDLASVLRRSASYLSRVERGVRVSLTGISYGALASAWLAVCREKIDGR